MIIAVMSPDRKQGVTTVSVLLAAAMGVFENLRVCLTYTGESEKSYNRFLGLDEETDITRTLGQIARLIDSHAIRGSEIENYMVRIGTNTQLMRTSDATINERDRNKIITNVVEELDHDIVIIDIGTELTDDVTQYVLDHADLVLCVTDQNARAMDKIATWYEEGIADYAPDPDKTVFVGNRFDANITSLRNYASYIAVRARRVAKISYNPWIIKEANAGYLQGIINYLLEDDERTIDLYTDMKQLTQMVLANLGYTSKWGES